MRDYFATFLYLLIAGPSIARRKLKASVKTKLARAGSRDTPKSSSAVSLASSGLSLDESLEDPNVSCESPRPDIRASALHNEELSAYRSSSIYKTTLSGLRKVHSFADIHDIRTDSNDVAKTLRPTLRRRANTFSRLDHPTLIQRRLNVSQAPERSFVHSPAMSTPRIRPAAGSVTSYQVTPPSRRLSTATSESYPLSDDGTTFSSSSPGSLITARTSVEEEEPEKAVLPPPDYALAAHPSIPASYVFKQVSPFTMRVMSVTEPGRTFYTVNVGLNVWMPSATVTYLRRGEGDLGPLVAQLEMGIATASATITFADECRALGSVVFRKNASSSSRYYFTGDGSIIRWKLKPDSWQAFSESKLLATFDPNLPRALTVHPEANKMFDHIVVALLVLMREHLTPAAAQVGEAAALFNYNPHTSAAILQNQEW